MDHQQQNPPQETKKKKFNPLYWGLILVFAAIFVVCGVVIGDYWQESQDSKEAQQDVVDMYSTTSRLPIPTDTTNGTTCTTNGTTAPTNPSNSTAPTQSTAPTNPSTSPTSPSWPTQSENSVMLEEMKGLYERNNHLVGWIYIPGTESKYQNFDGINYPVLQTPNQVEWYNYYLDHNFYREEDSHGWIYVRENCKVSGVNGPSDNIVIYGHNMADGTMFGQIVNYRDESYYQAHKYIYFDTLYEHQLYEIIAVFETSGAGDGYPYHAKNDFKNEDDFNEFLNTIKNPGYNGKVTIQYIIPTTAVYGDQLITLSTCWHRNYADGRLVVVAKRIL